MIVKREFVYTPKGETRPVYVYLPDNYTASGKRYPVMYFFDGHNLFRDADATYGKSWGLQDFLDRWSKEIIIVGMECSHQGNDRLSEYLPYPATGAFAEFTPMGDETLRWVVEEVKPEIDRGYRTLPFRECTGIGGSSMGGLMALYGAVHYNEIFSKAACVSSAIGCCIRPLMKDMRAQFMDANTLIYLSWGTREAFGIKNPDREDRSSKSYGWNRRVADQAASTGAEVLLRCQVGGGHCEADWEKLVVEFMNFLWMK